MKLSLPCALSVVLKPCVPVVPYGSAHAYTVIIICRLVHRGYEHYNSILHHLVRRLYSFRNLTWLQEGLELKG